MAHGPDALDLAKIEDTRRVERARKQERVARAIVGVRKRLGPGATRSLALFVPGLGQILRGRTTDGLFFLCSIIFCAVLARAVLISMDRLLPILELLGLPNSTVIWALVSAYLGAAVLQLTCVRIAAGPRLDHPHPAAACAASLLVPGWGQLLNGDRRRAVLFLAGAWVFFGIHIATSSPATELLNRYAPAVGTWEQLARSREILWAAHWTLPLALWCVASYDAASSALFRRKLDDAG